ncbi:hypothetical protein [Nocardia sp. CA-135398]|uniref:hypothetical protein n=1 Tax=Nocardia sp. CA-135398 TaxID=3239977 RepID=UPI003D99A66A
MTAELGDGTMQFLVGPKVLGEHIVEPITSAAEQAGRPRIVAIVRGQRRYRQHSSDGGRTNG